MRGNVPRDKADEIQEASDHWAPGAFEAGHEKNNVKTLGSVLRSSPCFMARCLAVARPLVRYLTAKTLQWFTSFHRNKMLFLITHAVFCLT